MFFFVVIELQAYESCFTTESINQSINQSINKVDRPITGGDLQAVAYGVIIVRESFTIHTTTSHKLDFFLSMAAENQIARKDSSVAALVSL